MFISMDNNACVYVNQKTWIKHAQNRMQLQMKTIMEIKKLHVRA